MKWGVEETGRKKGKGEEKDWEQGVDVSENGEGRQVKIARGSGGVRRSVWGCTFISSFIALKMVTWVLRWMKRHQKTSVTAIKTALPWFTGLSKVTHLSVTICDAVGTSVYLYVWVHIGWRAAPVNARVYVRTSLKGLSFWRRIKMYTHSYWLNPWAHCWVLGLTWCLASIFTL